MAAILFGSIGTIAETSEIQRAAFNQAFACQGLNWNWSRAEYIDLLGKSGGRKRIEAFADRVGQQVDVAALHRLKSEIFQEKLRNTDLEPRPGVLATIRSARDSRFGVALVTTTSEQNISALFRALGERLSYRDFDLIVNASQVRTPKPAKDAYIFALSELGERPESCLAIEDNVEGLAAARAGGLPCVAFPGANTAGHAFSGAALRTENLNFADMKSYLTN